MKSALPAQPNQSLLDGLAILSRISVSREPRGVTALAKELGLELTRVNRLVKTMAHAGFLYRTAGRTYAPGAGLHVLAAHSLFASGTMERSRNILGRLAVHGRIVAFGVLWGGSVFYLYHWAPGLAVDQAFGRLALYPAHLSSLGVALLADRTPREAAAFAAKIPKRERAAFAAALAGARERGFAEIPSPGGGRSIACTVGAPPYAALGLSGPITDGEMPDLIGALRAAKAEIEAAMNSPKTKDHP